MSNKWVCNDVYVSMYLKHELHLITYTVYTLPYFWSIFKVFNKLHQNTYHTRILKNICRIVELCWQLSPYIWPAIAVNYLRIFDQRSLSTIAVYLTSDRWQLSAYIWPVIAGSCHGIFDQRSQANITVYLTSDRRQLSP